jgi:hypothetical protein
VLTAWSGAPFNQARAPPGRAFVSEAIMAMTHVLPFPRIRDRGFVWRIARRMAELPPRTAEKHLAYQLRIQVETMQRRGIAPDLIERQRADLEAAVRGEFCDLSMTGGAA